MAEQHLSRPAGGTPAEGQETHFDHDWMLEPFAHLDSGLASRLADLSRIASAVDAIARVLEGSAVQNDFDGGQGLAASTLGGLHSALVVLAGGRTKRLSGCPVPWSQAMSVETLLSRLEGVRQSGPGRWMARCPAHSDRTASLSIREADGGNTLIHCFAGCEPAAVLAAVGLSLTDLFADGGQRHTPGRRSRIPAADILAALAHEAAVVEVGMEALLRGDQLPDTDIQRLHLAVSRISTATSEAL